MQHLSAVRDLLKTGSSVVRLFIVLLVLLFPAHVLAQAGTARISIAPNATNQVGQLHTFTVTLQKDTGAGFVPAAGQHVDFTLTNSLGATAILNAAASTCDDAGPNTNAAGQCTIVFTSATAGSVTGTASSTLSVNGSAPFTVQTNGVAPNSGPATKTFVNANILITAGGTNLLGQTRTLTAHVNVNAGQGGGFVNAPAGTPITFAIVSGPGSFTTSNSCATVGTTGSCTVTLTSASVGTTVVSAASTLLVNGVSITRATGTAANTAAGGSGNASGVWVDANIRLTPATGSSPTGTNHVLTVTANALGGTIDAGPHTATASIVSGPGSFVGANTCTYAGGAATASCTVTITSAVVGTTVVTAASMIPVGGLTITRTTNTATNTAAGGSGNASKAWVNANIQLVPAGATGVVGTNHVLTVTVNALGGTIDPGPHTATVSIVSGPGSFVGSPTCTYTGGAATGSCTVTITSAAVGTTAVSATSDVPVSGQTITRTTNTAVNTAAGGSGNANKIWGSANIQLTPANDANAVGTNHVLTVTVNAPGWAIDPGPHTATVSIVSGPGSFAGPNTCTYEGSGPARCAVTITSAVVGTTVVSATSDIPVFGGVTITRTTNTAANTAAGGSGNASKAWVDANIRLAPATASGPVGTNHVLTVTMNALNGNIDAGPHPATASIVSGPGSFVGPNTCTYTGGAATASCTVTITSAVVGTTVVSADSNVPVNGQTNTRVTNTAVNTAAGGSGNASKMWVDANIRLVPAAASSPVGTNPALTVTVNAPGGTIDAGPHTATASIVSGPGSFVGSSTCTYTGGAATASCTVTITSAVVGTTVVAATAGIPVGSATITRTTNTAVNTAAGGSGNAGRSWIATNVPAPALIGVTARKVHAAAGAFDLPLGPVATNPTIEPRQGPTHTIVFAFDKAVTAGSAVVAEGAAIAGGPTFSGNEMTVALSNVANAQYVSLAVFNVNSVDGGVGGSGSIRIGFLFGDVNQNRAVTLADLGLVNSQIAQLVTSANYLRDVNASGTLSLADKGLVNTQITKALPAP